MYGSIYTHLSKQTCRYGDVKRDLQMQIREMRAMETGMRFLGWPRARYLRYIDIQICQKRPIDMGASDECCTDMDEAFGTPGGIQTFTLFKRDLQICQKRPIEGTVSEVHRHTHLSKETYAYGYVKRDLYMQIRQMRATDIGMRSQRHIDIKRDQQVCQKTPISTPYVYTSLLTYVGAFGLIYRFILT